MKTAPFKLKSGNKPDIAKMAGVSPAKKVLPEVKVTDKKKQVKSKRKIQTSKKNRDEGFQGYLYTYTDGSTSKRLEQI